MTRKAKVEIGSGSIFADLDLPDAGTHFLKDRRKDIGPGLLNAMLNQLGLTKADLED